ncbi:MAG: hypothetical protein E6J84_14375 [Deltaproteobacteria bacterium]|nr:MAG: hypothetical protein E6J84_14375 [Deltaproteobacteria bacterium]
MIADVPRTAERADCAGRRACTIRAGQVSRKGVLVILANNSYLTTFSDGTQRYTGTFKERIINKTSGKYIDFNGSGPVILVYNADGTVTETDFGPQFERPPGQLLLTNGQFVWTYDSSFNVLSAAQISGTSRDVCTLLS